MGKAWKPSFKTDQVSPILDDIVDLLRSYRLPMGNELRLQDAIEQLLLQHEIPYLREHSFSKTDRIDFLAGTIGIECKVEGSPANVLSQLLRYTEHKSLTGLILVSTRNTHRFQVADIGGIPFKVVRVGAQI